MEAAAAAAMTQQQSRNARPRGQARIPTQPRSGGHRSRRQPRAANIDEAPSESSTDASSTGSEAVTDEGSGAFLALAMHVSLRLMSSAERKRSPGSELSLHFNRSMFLNS